MPLLLIGAFECPDKAPFPSHVPPLIAEKTELGYRRVFYDWSGNPMETPGDNNWVENPKDILKNVSIIRVDEQSYAIGNQVIYLGRGRIISEKNKLKIITKLLPFLFSIRALCTLRTIANMLL